MEVAAESGPGTQVGDPSDEQTGSADGTDSAPAEDDAHDDVDATAPAAESQGGSRVNRRWAIGIAAGLTLASAALAVGGYLGLRDHRVSQHLNAENAAAVSAAKECVAATQVPASDDMVAAEQKILECATGQFYAQAVQNAGFFVHAFKMGQVHTEVAEIRAAAERDNPDGSVDVLVAFRVKVDNVEAKGKEYGYRLRAQMVSVNGAYRIADLQQVSR